MRRYDFDVKHKDFYKTFFRLQKQNSHIKNTYFPRRNMNY